MHKEHYRSVNILILLMFSMLLAIGISTAQETATTANPSVAAQSSVSPPSTYVLGPDDQILIQGPEADEIVNKPYRVDPEGEVSLPLIGRIRAAGLTVRQFEEEVNHRLQKYIRQPQLVVSIVEFRSQPVSVVGAVNQPGTQQLQGRKTLMQMISMVGGFRADAGHTVKITRDLQWGPIPLPNATVDAIGKYSVAEVNLPDLLDAKNPRANILIMPNDLITVPPAETVYVIGDVKKAGGFMVNERTNMSVLQALAMAEGISATSDAKHSRIIHRTAEGTEPNETLINVKSILAGKSPDITLNGGDILFIPGSLSKKAGLRTVEAAIQTATGIAIWRF
jgi:polysaccharide export outer membrane protein